MQISEKYDEVAKTLSHSFSFETQVQELTYNRYYESVFEHTQFFDFSVEHFWRLEQNHNDAQAHQCMYSVCGLGTETYKP